MAGNLAGTTFGVPGANINNNTAGGTKYPGGTQYTTTGYQPVLGVYAQNTVDTCADTNYIGVNCQDKWIAGTGNYIADIGVSPIPAYNAAVNDNPATGGLARWTRAAGTIAQDAVCTIAADGTATTGGGGLYTCKVIGGVATGDLFWATVTATT